jgi:gluconokinase
MEGITYHRFSAFKAVEEVVGGVQSIRVSGGFVKSPTWLQLMADIYGRELLIPEVIENTAWGAACMALLSLRLLKRPEDIRSMVSVREVVHPNPDNTRKYQQFFARYQELCEKIASGGAAD